MTKIMTKERQRKAGETKKKRTRERILLALEELLTERPARSITLTDVCNRAGCSTDPLYEKHHETLRVEVDERIAARAKEEFDELPPRRRRLPLTMTAELKIKQLEDELAILKQRYKASQQAMNVLSQVIERLAPPASNAQPVLQLLNGFKPSGAADGGNDEGSANA